MAKKVIRLTETEFREFVMEAASQVLQEHEGFTFGRIPNDSLEARNDLANNIITKKVGRKVNPNDSTQRLDKAKELDKRIYDSETQRYRVYVHWNKSI